MIKKIIIFFCVCLAFTNQNSQAQTTYLPHYSIKNGLPSNYCYYTIQDRNGFLWIATQAGLSRFNGKFFQNFSVDDGLSDNQIIYLYEDRKGRIWILSLNGQISYFYNGLIYNSSTDKKLASLNLKALIVSVYEDNRGFFWFGTNKNLIVRWDGHKTVKYTAKDTSPRYFNAYITEDENGKIVAANAVGLFRFNGLAFKQVITSVLPYSYKTVLGKGKSFFMMTPEGLYANGDKISLPPMFKDRLNSSSIGYIAKNGNQLWVPTQNGVMAFNGGLPPQNYLPGISVNHVLVDKFKNIWFTTNNGIYKLPNIDNRLYIKSKENGLANNNIKSLAKDSAGNIWLGFAHAKMGKIHSNGSYQQIEISANNQFAGDVKQIEINAGNHLFFASDNQLGYFDIEAPKPSVLLLRESSNALFVIKNFALGRYNQLALALSSGVVIINERDMEFSSKAYGNNQLFLPDRAYRTYFDHQGVLWFSNVDGLKKTDGSHILSFDRNDKLINKRITDIRQLDDQTMVLGTDGYGILLLKKDKLFKQITTKQGLNSNIITKIFVANNSIWCNTNKGINKIALANNQFKVTDYTNDLLSSDVNDFYIDADTAYFATNYGLVYFNHLKAKKTGTLPPTFITSIAVDGKPQDLSKPQYKINPGKHNILVNFSAINFDEKDITYQYRINPDEAWLETKNRKLELFSLGAGSYQLEVRAKAQGGIWGAAQKIELTVGAYFWQTKWFLFLAIAVGAFAVFKGAVFITHRQKNREQEQLRLKNKILVLEQRALQAMMNPHFVFNVMNSIQHYININNTASANKILTGFAKLIRKNLDIVTQSYISLEEEIDYLKLYLNLEKHRFGEKMQFELAIDKRLDLEETMIPAMLLQPFVENAIWHGIMPKAGGGLVQIKITAQSNHIDIAIIDDGIGIENAKQNKPEGHISKGLALTADRIALLNKIESKPIHYKVQQNGSSGTTVLISIPQLH